MTAYIKGARMAVVQHQHVVGVRTIDKVYANGNFTLVAMAGREGRQPQWRPNGDIATQCGGVFRYGASHLEPWSETHAERWAEQKRKVDIEARTKKIIAAIEQKDLTAEQATAMETLLGITVGGAQ